jgi:hypothetical protein
MFQSRPEPSKGRHVCRTDRDIVRANPARGETCLLNFYRLRHIEQIFRADSTTTRFGSLSLFALQTFHPYGASAGAA